MRRYLRSILSIALAVALVCTNSGLAFAAEKTVPSKNVSVESTSKDTGKQEEDKNFLQKLAEVLSGQKGETEKATEKTTEKATEKTTEKSTEETTEKATEKTTEKSTEKETEKVTEKSTEKETEKTTEKSTEKSTEKTTEKSTVKETEKATEKSTEKETEKTTEKETEKASEKETEKKTEKTTEKAENKTGKVKVKKSAKESKSTPVRVGNVDVYLDVENQELLGANNTYLEGLTTQKLDFTTEGDVTLSVKNGEIYGSKNSPILPEYNSSISMPDSISVLNLLWNRQKEKKMEEYQFVNRIPDEIKIPSPVYFQGGESVLEATGIRSKFVEQNYGGQGTENAILYEHTWRKKITVHFVAGGVESDTSNPITWQAYTPMSVRYTVDIAPLNEGGSPTISGLTELDSETTTLSPKVLGVNSQYFRNGEINTGVDGGETLDCGNNTAVTGSYTGNGMRGYGTYGTGYSWSPNPANGYSVDYVEVTVYDPLDGMTVISKEKISGSQLSRLSPGVQGKTEIRVKYTKEPEITKSGSMPKEVKKGDEITYNLTVTNPGSTATEVVVRDTLPKQVEAVSYSIDGVKQSGNWSGQRTVTIPPRVDDVDGKVEIEIKTKVIQDYSSSDLPGNIINNQAFMDYKVDGVTKTDKTEEVKHYLKPVISYTLEKRRVTEPEGDGFIAGDDQVIDYAATVVNTGTVPLTLKISDQFADQNLFTFVGDTAKEGITLGVGEKKEVTFQAKVLKGTAPNLDGYLNTVTAEAEVSYVDAETGNTVTVDKTTPGYEDIMELQDTAKTPVIATIWVANTTEENQGGIVEVEGFEDTKSQVSSDGNDNNGVNRKPATTVKGSAKDGWVADLTNITVGVRDGQVVVLTSENPEIGAFWVIDDAGNKITGTVQVSSDHRTVEVTLNDLPKDIDVGISFVPDQEPEITKEGSTPEQVKKGDIITYKLTVTNPGFQNKEVVVTDILPKGVKARSFKIDSKKQDVNWNGTQKLTVPGRNGQRVIEIEAEVTDSFDAESTGAKVNVIENQASMTYKMGDEEKEKETQIVTHYLKPRISYELKKERLTNPQGDGFIAGDGTVITYRATLKNTGDIDITVNVGDVFEDSGLFTFIGDTQKEFVLAKGETKSVDFTATVNEGTAPNSEGYVNTVTSEGTAKYTDPKSKLEVEVTKDQDPEMVQTDTARTPVMATIWVANTTAGDRGGTVEVTGFADTVSKVSSDGADDNAKNRKPALEVKGTADEKWIVDTAGITVGVRDLEAVTIKDVAEDGRFTVRDSKGNTITGTVLVSEDKRSVTVKTDSLDQDLDVGITFIPTIQVANVKVTQDKTKGGTVEVTDFSEPTRDETDRYPSNVVFGVPEAGWQVAVDTITVNGVRVRSLTPNGDGTYTVTDQDQNQIIVQIEETEKGTAVRILNMQVPVDVDMEFEPTIFVKNPTDTQVVENGGSVWVENVTEPDPEDSGERYPSNVVLGRPMNDRWMVDTENIKVNGVTIHPNEKGEFQITDSNGYVIKGNFQMAGKDGVVTILGMDTLVDVDIPFVPTVWVENSTKDEQNSFTNAGGTVNVQNRPKDPASSDGSHNTESGRYPEQSVTGTPDPGWKVDKDAITVNGVPVLKNGVQNSDGTYTVTVENGYQITVSLKDGKNGEVVAEVMNMDLPVDVSIPFVRMLTVLRIHKVNVNGNPEDVFNFTVTLGSSKAPYTGSYTIGQETRKYTGPFTVSLKGGETVELKNIYALTEYQVTEEANDLYVSAGVNTEGVLEKENTDYTAEFTNTLREAGLNISKTVIGGNKEDSFAFQVTVDGKNFEGSYTVNGKEKKTADGIITLKGGQTAVIKGLPAEVKYQVKEREAGFYKLTDSSNTSGTLKAGEAVDVQFENTKKDPESVSVWVKAEKKYTNGTLSSGLFSFQLKGEGETKKAVNDADGSISFEKLTYSKAGTYQYTLSEVKGSLSDVTYDTTDYEVTVKVTLDEENNRLKAVTTYTKNGQKVSSPVFTNVKKRAAASTKKTTPAAKTADQTPVTELTFLLLAAGAVFLLLTGRRKKA